MGLNDDMFADPLDGDNSTVDPVITPEQAEKGTDSTFAVRPPGGDGQAGEPLTPQAIQELASGEMMIKNFVKVDANNNDLQSEKDSVISKGAVSQVMVKAAVETYGLVLPENLPLCLFTKHATKTYHKQYVKVLDSKIAAESQSSIGLVHQLFGEPIEKALMSCEHILSQHIGALQSVISQMSASAQDYKTYTDTTKNVIFVRSSPSEEDGPFINVIERSLSEFKFTDINYNFNKRELTEHAAGLDDVFKMRSIRVLFNLFLAGEPLEDVFAYSRMSGDVINAAPSLTQIIEFSTSPTLLTLPQSMSEVCTATLNKLIAMRAEYVELRPNEEELLSYVRTNSKQIGDCFRTSVHLVSVCYALGQMAYHTSEMYRRLKLKQ